MVDAEVGGLSVFPALEEELDHDEEDEDGLPLSHEDLSPSRGAEAEDPSLLKKLLLTPPNVPTGVDALKEGHRYSNRSLHLRPVRPLVKTDLPQERKPRAVRPASRLCTELHRHLTTAQEAEGAAPEEEEEEEEEEGDDENSESEDEESSSSEVEAAAAAAEPAKPQFSSDKELRSVVELITYMHTYCLPTRKQQGWERKEQDLHRPRARPEAARAPGTGSHSRVILVASPGSSGGSAGPGSAAPRRLPFARRREMKADSLLRQLLQQSAAFDVSKPYRLHSAPYTRSHSPNAGGATGPKPELSKDCCSPERTSSCCEGPRSPEAPEDGGSFSVRRSLRLASFPSRFAKRLRPGRARGGEAKEREHGRPEVKAPPACCHNEKRACLCLPLNPKSTGESQYSTKAFEQTLSVDLCGTAGLTPPTTPPHKPVEDELFKPAEGGKAGAGSTGGGGGNEPIAAKSSSWLSRGHHQRKLPEQTELYAQLRRMGQTGHSDSQRRFGDHDYCALSLADNQKPSAALLGAVVQVQGGAEGAGHAPTAASHQECDGKEAEAASQEAPEQQAPPTASPQAEATPPSSEEEAECSSRSPSPVLHLCPDSPASKTDSSENSEIGPDDEQRNKATSEEDNCQVFYIHNLPSSVTQNMLRKRFQVFGNAEDCKVIVCNEERCGVIKIRQSGLQRHWRERDTVFQNGPGSLRRLTRKRYIDLDEAGPGPVKSKYDALDFDTLLKEAQMSLQR
ncbi:peroxisome proliferator-activated receptor gamma coactivator 1-beta-like [Betta splendens]|uniref:Peroxisome proliferator-activated receptor gamma coactivator 1-beta-like n=1 Tax=Betta splendens TaxID=158456 RepID=A0A6P7NTY9_BETSP|nr:peroxisome proliferator-activated receptor gamma coactivator 1-beta-like [Betta splendens]